MGGTQCSRTLEQVRCGWIKVLWKGNESRNGILWFSFWAPNSMHWLTPTKYHFWATILKNAELWKGFLSWNFWGPALKLLVSTILSIATLEIDVYKWLTVRRSAHLLRFVCTIPLFRVTISSANVKWSESLGPGLSWGPLFPFSPKTV